MAISKLGRKINYPKERKPLPEVPKLGFKLDNSISHEFKKYDGQPSKSRYKRALVSQSSPHHFIFGNNLPVWKTWQTYAQNMGLLEADNEP